MPKPEMDAFMGVYMTFTQQIAGAGRVEAVRSAYHSALSLTRQAAERRFLQRRLDELGGH